MKILKSAYHRNGVCGRGFSVVLFEHGDNPGRTMLGVMFNGDGDGDEDDDGVASLAPKDYATAVFDLGLLKDDVIEFGKNSWRGDNYQGDIARGLAKRWPWGDSSPEAGIALNTPDTVRAAIERQAADILLGPVAR
jgi:hypothetical protein